MNEMTLDPVNAWLGERAEASAKFFEGIVEYDPEPWRWFLVELATQVGLGPPELLDDAKIKGCKHGYDKSIAEELLEKMILPEGIEPWWVLMAFEDLGGHCDCEIVMNVIDCFPLPEETEATD